MSHKKIVLATQNQNKLAEVRQILQPLGYQIISLADVNLAHVDVIEDGATFEENAIKKAREISTLCRLPVLADDSGLAVDALNGAPGVYSARYSGEDANYAKNNQKLLIELAGVVPEKRTAKFVCAMAYIDSSSQIEHVVRGEVNGIILEALKGQGGFGYDPLFYVPEIKMTFAQASPQVKHRLSHRGRALLKMCEKLEE